MLERYGKIYYRIESMFSSRALDMLSLYGRSIIELKGDDAINVAGSIREEEDLL